MPDLVRFLTQRDMPYEAIGEQGLVSAFSVVLPDGRKRAFDLLLLEIMDDLGDDYVRFAILPYLARPPDGFPLQLLKRIGEINYELPCLKFVLDDDGDLGLILDICADRCDDTRFDFALQLLADYGGAYEAEFATMIGSN